MRRFFVDPRAIDGHTARLHGSEARHLATVLRLRPGAETELFDGTGLLYRGRVQQVRPDLVEVEILERLRPTPARSPVTLAMALVKGKKMDMLVRRATELGVARFLPVQSRFCENHGRRERQLDRWQRIMLQACKQCRRVTPMEIGQVRPLAELDTAPYHHRIMAWEAEEQDGFPAALATDPGPVCLLVGPEGGFDADEVAWARGRGFTCVSLGPLVLTADTAALAAIAITGHLCGWLGPRQEG